MSESRSEGRVTIRQMQMTEEVKCARGRGVIDNEIGLVERRATGCLKKFNRR